MQGYRDTILIVRYQIRFIWYIFTYSYNAHGLNKSSVFFSLPSVQPLSNFHHKRCMSLSCESFSLAKVGRLVTMPRTIYYSETNTAAAFHRFMNLGIPLYFFPNFLAKATSLASLWGSKEKDSKRYAVDDDWKF